MDSDLKAQADALFSELGMNLTTAFNIFVRQSIREGGIPFEISINQPLSTGTIIIRYLHEKYNTAHEKRYNLFSNPEME